MKISVITVCRNAEDSIEETIVSVLDQTFKDLEYVIVDGDSTDNTKQLLSKYKDRIKIVSEKDKSVYDAMNKGVALASGEYLIFMNSGDKFSSNLVIEKMFENEVEEVDVLYGDVFVEEENEVKSQKNFGIPFLMYDNLCHQSMFIRRECFEILGEYSLEYKIASDLDWLIRATQNKEIRMKYVDMVVADYRGGGISSNVIKYKAEESIILEKYFSDFEIIVNKIVFKVSDFIRKNI